MAKHKIRNTCGFGFDPTQSPHHFIVNFEGKDRVNIEERFVWGDIPDNQDSTFNASRKAILDTYRWSRISLRVAETFNKRLRVASLSTATWMTETQLTPHLGKELTLLFWAVEDADPTLIPMIMANWEGLAPEERWWLYTTINATSGHPDHGHDRGWRKAIKIAFAENPISPTQIVETAIPMQNLPTRRRTKSEVLKVEMDQIPLF